MNLDYILNNLEKKMTFIAYVFWKLQTVKDVLRQMSKKSFFRRPFERRHYKRTQTLLKYGSQHF